MFPLTTVVGLTRNNFIRPLGQFAVHSCANPQTLGRIATRNYRSKMLLPQGSSSLQAQTNLKKRLEGKRSMWSWSVPKLERFTTDYYYELLGVKRDATIRQLRDAFCEKINMHHPNAKNTKYYEIQEAFSILKNRIKRRQYNNGFIVYSDLRPNQYCQQIQDAGCWIKNVNENKLCTTRTLLEQLEKLFWDYTEGAYYSAQAPALSAFLGLALLYFLCHETF